MGKHSEEAKLRRIGKPSNHKGKKMSEESKKKISDAHKKLGTKPPSRKGIKTPLDVRIKISKAGIGRVVSEKTRNKISKTKKGHIVSKETREKISKANNGKNTGSNSHSWRGGITPINKSIRNSTDYMLWRKSCFERDNFTCQKTGQYGGKLEIHHINNFEDFPELRFAIDNGITLSKESHKEFHKTYGRRNNTKEQLQEYLNN
jgi:hypothetical protein